MSNFRTLFPEPNNSASAGLIHKLEKALILCEILQTSTSNSFFESEETVSYISNLTSITFSGDDIWERDNKKDHIKIRKISGPGVYPSAKVS